LPEQKLTITEALRSFTVDAAFGAYQEKAMGSLQPGMWADFILLDRDPVKGPAEQIWQTQVQQTYVAGKLLYQRP